MAIWMIRSGERGRHERNAIINGRVSINFNLVRSITEFTGQDDLREHLYSLPAHYPTRQKAGRAASQLLQFADGRHFAYDLHDGDTVMMPFYGKTNVAVGIVRGEYAFRPDLSGANAGEPGPHIREMDWLAKNIPRARFGKNVRDLLENHKRFTVARISGGEGEDENRIQRIARTHAS